MSGKLSVFSTVALFSLSALCQGATPMAQGVIRFSGSIVESSCTLSSQAGGWGMDDCPTLARGADIDVRRIAPQASVSALDNAPVKVRLVADRTSGRYYNQQYALVDKAGNPVTAGNYLITLTSP
ncbi:type 1 fimbrial protein [Pseudomonas sp. BJa5]|uniref:type 1 fimbrial protein n=1 Tax=Pseudomonas sp. BJa5 TaxID=2936270 RepID=UPI00255A07F5|nr:type 1 fimbrial protein [Pseudomonas sp. BGr12]MDL2421283.1 type 1 fimbrial protein [Pseudomonas sp. BGr12]